MEAERDDLLAASRGSERAGDIATALEQASQALDLARATGDQRATAAALNRLAAIHCSLGHFRQARELALSAMDAAGGTAEAADALLSLGMAVAWAGDLARAEEYFHEAIDLSRQLGYAAGHARALQGMTMQVYLPRGHFDLALAAIDEAARIDAEGHETRYGALMGRAWLCYLRGHHEQARAALVELRAQGQGEPRLIGAHSYIAACLALDEGDLEQAHMLLDEALAAAETTGHPQLNVAARVLRSRWHRLQGSAPAAHTWAAAAAAYARRIGAPQLEGQALIERGQAARDTGDLAAAEADLLAAAALLATPGATVDQAHGALVLSALYQQLRRPQAEVQWLEAVERITRGGFEFLLERERALAFPLIAAQLHSPSPPARAAADALLEQLRHVAPPPLYVVTLGRFTVRRGARQLASQAWQRRRAGELFRFLLLQPGRSACREEIVEALWPDRPPDSAQQLLHQATSALRHILEPDLPERFPSRYLVAESSQVTLQLPPGSTVDAELFEAQVAAALETGDAELLGQTLRNFRGDLLPVDRYAAWITPHRERLLRLRLRALQTLAGWRLAAGRPAEALDCADEILSHDQWCEDAVLLAMQACLALRDRPGALRRYSAYSRAARRGLGIAPRLDIQLLADSLHGET